MLKHPACGNTPALPYISLSGHQRAYLTGKRPRALWQRFRMWRAYRRPVTFEDLRRIAYDANRACPSTCAVALFDKICREAERSVIG
ncbi:hypothetical protein [Rhodovulum sulfidophilum]|uniref:hypothetical protein n=1 Tax=Rhodovulum sulfidophilum TaxID=35806 RepID=UPI00117AB24F|nr:hypothetical protein [Rhodovulum sulfidophilum]